MKLTDSKKDSFRRLARDQGYRSRSAFKLKQINQSYRILNKGDCIVDIGCAPGGWMQIALPEVGTKGKVIGVDIKKIEPLSNAFIIQGNIEDEHVTDNILKISNSCVDVVLSDLSPNVSGNWELDHARQIDLTRNALRLSSIILKKRGKAVFKVFQGDMLNELVVELKKKFKKVILTKPNASRQVSSEIYLICLDYNPG
ncbi:MAG TPA: RlmE family RNA methyltransferase [Nitrososphaeraceae archaeon]|jgi:23S rRNA (uridine2552-2'-O)-methyltransferase|nr:RlmE family RNA methyltransferase [Nitrososphaeraceae archaeon]